MCEIKIGYLCDTCAHKEVCRFVKEHRALEDELRSVLISTYVPHVQGVYALCTKFNHE